MKTLATAAAMVLTLTGVAGAAPLPGFVLATETERVSFFTRGGKVDAQKVERRIAELETVFGHRLGRRVQYFRYGSAQEVAAGTGHYAAGVTFAATGEVHSTEAFHDHELVHLVAGQLGDPGAFFQEGLAVALGNRGKWNGRSTDAIARRHAGLDVAALVNGFDRIDGEVAYPVAGSFVGYLIRTHGMAQVAAFFRACTPGADTGRGFEQAFGTGLAQAAADWRASLG